MKYRYSRYVEDALDGIDMDSLVSQLSDLLLSSGFDNPWDPESDADRTMQALHDAILDALLNGGVLSNEMLDRLMDDQTKKSEGQEQRDALEALIQRIIERLTEQGYITMAGKPQAQALGSTGEAQGEARFEVTDKALDFLGYRALRDLLGSLGRSSAGRPRHARARDRASKPAARRALRVRRHDESGCRRDDPQRGEAAGRRRRE